MVIGRNAVCHGLRVAEKNITGNLFNHIHATMRDHSAPAYTFLGRICAAIVQRATQEARNEAILWQPPQMGKPRVLFTATEIGESGHFHMRGAHK